MYSLPTLSSLYPKPKKRMKRLPTRSLTYWGILAIKAANKNQEDCPEDCSHLQRLAQDATICTSWVSYFSTHFNRGNPPLSLSVQHGSSASHGGRSPVNRSYAKVQALLNLKCMTTLYKYIKRSRNKLPTRRFVPMKFKKETLCPKAYYLFNQTPRASGRLTMKARMQYF